MTTEITTQELASRFSNVRQAHSFFVHDCSLHLPDVEFCSLNWMSDILSGTKEVSKICFFFIAKLVRQLENRMLR